mgnify:CR=1 FL=1
MTDSEFFTRVEALRAHMLLTVAQMAKILGTTRATYSGWVKGKPIRATNEERVRTTLRRMMQRAINEHDWPQPGIIAMTSSQRFNTLLELMEEDA